MGSAMLDFAEMLSLSCSPRVHSPSGGPEDRYPRLHEQQILENWRAQREQRVQTHAQRVAEHLRRFSRGGSNSGITQGKRRATWCVEMHQRFESVTAAGRFVGRPPSNILQAIRDRNRCGSYHWEYFDPARHIPSEEVVAAGELAV